VVRCGFKNIHQKDTCLKEIGLRAQNMTYYSTFSSQNILRGLIWPLMNTQIFIFTTNMIFIRAPNIIRKWRRPRFGIANMSCTHHLLHILGEVGRSANITIWDPSTGWFIDSSRLKVHWSFILVNLVSPLIIREGESTTLNMSISVRWRLVLEPIVTQNTKCHLKVQLVLRFLAHS
jgi:hypothetical protein